MQMLTLRSLRELRTTLIILKLFQRYTDSVFQAVQASLTEQMMLPFLTMSCDLDAIPVAKTP